MSYLLAYLQLFLVSPCTSIILHYLSSEKQATDALQGHNNQFVEVFFYCLTGKFGDKVLILANDDQ